MLGWAKSLINFDLTAFSRDGKATIFFSDHWEVQNY